MLPDPLLVQPVSPRAGALLTAPPIARRRRSVRAHAVCVGYAWIAAAILLLVLPGVSDAQSIIFRDVDVSGFPTIRAHFRALDRDGRPITRLDPSDFMVTEEGVARPVTDVGKCDQLRPVPLTVGIMVDTKYHIDLARAGAARLVNFLGMPPSELGITTMDEGVYVVQDLTKNREKLLDKAAALEPAPGVDLQRMFYDPAAGGVAFVSGRPNRKILILISDLHCPNLNLDTARLFADAARERISVYAVLLNANDYTGLFKRIVGVTGGELFERVTREDQIGNIFQRIAMEQYGEPCELAWQSRLACDASRTAVVSIPSAGASGEITYNTPLSITPHLEFSPSGVSFGSGTSGGSADEQVTITARVGDVRVHSIGLTNGAFSVIDYGGAPPPFTLKKDESRSMRLHIVGDSGYAFGSLDAVTDFCPGRLFISGGLPGRTTSLVLKHPNGGEEFVVGSDTAMWWEGVLPEDRVRLEYSIDAGATWKLIGEGVLGLDLSWHVPNTPSRRCLARVTQLPGEKSDSIVKITVPQSTYRFAWNPLGNEVAALSGFDSSITVFDAIGVGLTGRFGLAPNNQYFSGDWSPDGSRIVIGGDDPVARVWSRVQQKELLALNHADPDPQHSNHKVIDVAWSPDGTFIASGSWDTYMRIWDATTGSVILKAPCGSEVKQVAWSFDGALLAARSASSMQVWRIADRAITTTLSGTFSRILFSPSDNQLAAVPISGLDDILVYDPELGTQTARLQAGTGYIRDLAWRPDGKSIAAISGRWLFLWDVASQSETYRINYNTQQPIGLAWSPDGRFVACAANAASGSNTIVHLRDPLTGAILDSLNLPGTVKEVNESPSIRWNSDGARLAIWTTSGLFIWEVVRPGLQMDLSDSLWAIVAPDPALNTIDIDMGTVVVGDDRDSLVTAVLCNRGGAPLHVLGMDLTAGDVGDFMIPSGAGDFTLGPGECRDITFEFTPAKLGSRIAKVTVRMAADTLRDTITVRGVGVAPVLEVESEDIDFGAVHIGDVKDTNVAIVLRNIGSLPITITGTPQGGPDVTQFAITGGGAPFTIDPGASHAMALRFTPQFVGRTTGRILFEFNGVGSPETVRLLGRGLGGIVYIPDDSAAAGEHFPLHLVIDTQGPRKVKDPQRFVASVGVDQTLIASTDAATTGTLDRGQRTLTIDGTWDGSSDTLASFPVVALLGSNDVSPLELLSFDWVDDADHPLGIETETQSGSFHLLGICREGTTRLYDELGVEAALKVAPNPAASRAELQYQLAEDGAVAIDLYDASGRHVRNVLEGDRKAGAYRVNIVTDELSSGMYVAVLRTPTQVVSARVEVRK